MNYIATTLTVRCLLQEVEVAVIVGIQKHGRLMCTVQYTNLLKIALMMYV